MLAVSSDQAVSATDQFFRPANGRPLADQPRMKPVYGLWTEEGVIVCVHDDHYLEVHCHGGAWASRRIVGDLQSAGFQEQTVRQAAIIPDTAADAWLEMGHTLTRKTAAIMNWQVHGALDRQIADIRHWIEAAATAEAQAAIGDLLRWQHAGLHLTRPWTVVVSGEPNVGKSSLINRILGYQRSIVYDMPGTTRDLVTARTAINGWPVEFVDTAGLRVAGDEIEQAGVALARQAIENADLSLEIVDATNMEGLSDPAAGQIRVFNKCDLHLPEEALAGERVSALTGQGIEQLLQAIIHHLVPHQPAAETGVPFLPEHIDGLCACQEHLRESLTPTEVAPAACQRRLGMLFDLLRLDLLFQPLEIRLTAPGNRRDNHFGFVVGMRGLDKRHHQILSLGKGLDRTQPFLSCFRLALPAIGAMHRAVDLYAGGEPLFHQFPGKEFENLLLFTGG